MATITPVAYSTVLSAITGTQKYNNLFVGTTEQDYGVVGAENGVTFWSSPDLDFQYVIAHYDPTGGHSGHTAEGLVSPVYLGFWGTKDIGGKTDEAFLNLVNSLFNQNFDTADAAYDYINTPGAHYYWTNYQLPTPTPTPSTTAAVTPTPTPTVTSTPTPSTTPSSSNLLVYLDSGNSSSYPGTGTTWFDLEGASNDATLINSPTYNSSYQGILQFDDVSLEYATIPNLGNLSQWTVEAWFRLSTALTGKVTSIVANQFDLTDKLNFSIGTNNAPANRNIAAGFYDGSWRTTTGFVPQVGVWYQVVGTYDGSVIRQYVNGAASGGTVNYVGTPQSGGEVRLMRRWDEALVSTNLVDGDLAIVKIYNSALSAGDVLTNYNSTFSRFLD